MRAAGGMAAGEGRSGRLRLTRPRSTAGLFWIKRTSCTSKTVCCIALGKSAGPGSLRSAEAGLLQSCQACQLQIGRAHLPFPLLCTQLLLALSMWSETHCQWNGRVPQRPQVAATGQGEAVAPGLNGRLCSCLRQAIATRPGRPPPPPVVVLHLPVMYISLSFST